ncbi:ABC transporter permease [Kitasatospora sp. NPDC085879]|uniref:ABC transporter permease n=1 Tax=Kitasatospora sp. NPDC085879 TaxID=3154769 RepID=UPI000BB0FD8D|nr:ABC transporter permease [Streptomyces sp. TLI_235]PBC78493.1 ABC-2 type transport system permease protein [Streptomyces sp. TLI_235]
MQPSPDARTAADGGVIHNIGYRRYEGPRLGRGYATRSLYQQSLRAAFGLGRSGRSKVLPMAMLALPLIIALVVASIQIFMKIEKPILDYTELLDAVVLMTWIFLAAQAPVLLSRDLRHHTVPLYFSRPITRADYVRAKFAAMISAMMIVMGAPLLVLYIGALLGRMDFGHHTVHLLYGLAAALLYAVLYSAIGLLIAASTPRRGFGVASIMGVMAVSSVIARIVYVLGGGEWADVPEKANWAAMLSPSWLVQGFTNQVFGLVANSRVVHAPGAGAAVLFGVEILLLTGACYWFTDRRYRKI